MMDTPAQATWGDMRLALCAAQEAETRRVLAERIRAEITTVPSGPLWAIGMVRGLERAAEMLEEGLEKDQQKTSTGVPPVLVTPTTEDVPVHHFRVADYEENPIGRSLRRRINVSVSVKGIKTWDCTVDGEGFTQAEILAESDSLVCELEARYPVKID